MVTETKFEGGNLIVTRVYQASREAVFDAWIETSKVKQWWGCAECTDVRSEIEPKVGGKYNHHMTIDGEFEAPGFAVFTEYDPPARLAYASPDPDDPMVITVDFTEVEGGTLVTLVHSNIPDITVEGDVELREIIRSGWTAATDKLGAFLSKTTQTENA